MTAKNIVVGQKVSREKLEQAKALRENMTPAETALWKSLKGDRLAGLHFRRQQIIRGFIVDFYCHSAGLIVELDGGVHDRKKVSDSERDIVLESLGLRVVRFRNEEVERDLAGVLGRIVAMCE
jgi:very-short-patch-repair endonuclease